MTFASLTGFGDTVGGGVATEYMSTRTGHGAGVDSGWATHAISPPQPASPLVAALAQFTSQYVGEFSSDLTAGVFRAWRPLTDAPAVANLVNLYVRTDLDRSGQGSYQLLSDCASCGAPFPPQFLFFFIPSYVAASADFGHVLFQSLANFVPEASGFQTKLYEWDHGTVRLAGILPDGNAAASSSGAGISSDGSRVFFTDDAGNLYMRENASTTIQLNRSENSTPGSPQPASPAGISSDGTRIFLTSSDALTDDAVGGSINLYLYDASRPDSDPHNLQFLTADHEPSDGTDASVDAILGLSTDGHTIDFITHAQIVAGQPHPSAFALFGWHDGSVAYVSPLPNASDSVGRVSSAGDVMFTLRAAVGPTGYDQGRCSGQPCVELYLYDNALHVLRCVSCDPSGAPGTGDAEVTVNAGSGALTEANHSNHPLTDDGHVFFDTPDSLVAADTNGRNDVYEYDAQTGGLSLISTGTDASDSYFMEATPDGRNVYFATRSQLVGWDRDQNYDLYDARVGGGFPGPPPGASRCTGDVCQGQLGGSPASDEGGGGGGAGDLPGVLRARHATGKHCKKGFVRRVRRGKVRCVKRRRHAHRAGQTASRRAGK